jgi:hypothetical protein
MQSLEARLGSYSSAVLSLFRVVIGFLYALHGTASLAGGGRSDGAKRPAG